MFCNHYSLNIQRQGKKREEQLTTRSGHRSCASYRSRSGKAYNAVLAPLLHSKRHVPLEKLLQRHGFFSQCVMCALELSAERLAVCHIASFEPYIVPLLCSVSLATGANTNKTERTGIFRTTVERSTHPQAHSPVVLRILSSLDLKIGCRCDCVPPPLTRHLRDSLRTAGS